MAAAAWYPDPEHPGWLRYWDGTRWTDHREPMPPPSGNPVHATAPDRSAIDRERESSGRARIAIRVYGVTVAVSIFISTAVAIRFDEMIDDMFAALDDPDPQPFGAVYDVDITILTGFSQLFGLVSIGAGIFFCIWVYRASLTARELGYHQRWSRTWTWLGFVVPVMNFFVPFQVLADALRADASRSTLWRWWTLVLAAYGMGMVTLVAAILGNEGVAWTITAGASACWVGVGLIGPAVVGHITEDHEAAISPRR